METYSRIGLLRGNGNLQSYWTTTKLWKLTVVLEYYEAIERALTLSYCVRVLEKYLCRHSTQSVHEQLPENYRNKQDVHTVADVGSSRQRKHIHSWRSVH